MLRSALTACLLITSACSVGATPDTTEPVPNPGALVAWDSDSIAVFDEPGSANPRRQLETSGLGVSQVTPSPDGSVVWTGAAVDGSGFASVVTSLSTGISAEIEVPTAPFFYAWNPRGDRVAFLGNDPGGTGVLFGSLDPAAGVAQRHGVATPFFLDWSPDGAQVAANIGATRLGIIDVPGATVTDLGFEPGRFATPLWTNNGLFLARGRSEAVAGPLRQISFQTDSNEIVKLDVASGDRTTLTTADVPVRLFAGLDGRRLAVVGGEVGDQRLVVLDVDSGTVIAERTSIAIDLVQWSPDGDALLYTTRTEQVGQLIPRVLQPGRDIDLEFEPFAPSDELASAYLPFWDQYDRALSLWSADSTTFAVAVGGARIRIVPLEGDPVEVEGFSMAAFAPVPSP